MIEYFERVAKMAKSDNQSPEMSAIAEIADKAVANPEWANDHGGDDLDPGVQIQLIVASAKNKSNEEEISPLVIQENQVGNRKSV